MFRSSRVCFHIFFLNIYRMNITQTNGILSVFLLTLGIECILTYVHLNVVRRCCSSFPGITRTLHDCSHVCSSVVSNCVNIVNTYMFTRLLLQESSVCMSSCSYTLPLKPRDALVLRWTEVSTLTTLFSHADSCPPQH